MNVPSNAYTFESAKDISDIDVTCVNVAKAFVQLWRLLDGGNVSDHIPIEVVLANRGGNVSVVLHTPIRWNTRSCTWVEDVDSMVELTGSEACHVVGGCSSQ